MGCTILAVRNIQASTPTSCISRARHTRVPHVKTYLYCTWGCHQKLVLKLMLDPPPSKNVRHAFFSSNVSTNIQKASLPSAWLLRWRCGKNNPSRSFLTCRTHIVSQMFKHNVPADQRKSVSKTLKNQKHFIASLSPKLMTTVSNHHQTSAARFARKI